MDDYYIDPERLVIRARVSQGTRVCMADSDTLVKITSSIAHDKAKVVKNGDTIEIIENDDLSHVYAEVRRRRNILLAESDWTQGRDCILANDTEWVAYRQALRDITKNPDPTCILFPASPK